MKMCQVWSYMRKYKNQYKNIVNFQEKAYRDKLMQFAIRIVKLKNYLNEQKHEYNIANQIQRPGMAIGANHREACNAVSTAEFVDKLAIAQKEANETIYWLKVLCGSTLISKVQYEDLQSGAEELYKIFTASIKTAKDKTHYVLDGCSAWWEGVERP